MRGLFAPAIFASEEQTRKAGVFCSVVCSIMLMMTGLGIAATINQPELFPRTGYTLLAINVLSLALLHLNRRGWTQLAGVLYIAGLLAVVTIMSPPAGGIRAPGVMMYFILVLMAGLLLGERAGVLTALICAAMGLVLIALERLGLMPPQTVFFDTVSMWLLNCIFMGNVIIFLRLSTRTVGQALHRAEAELAERRRTEERLEHALEEAQSMSRAKAAFFAAMSHELRTPLNAIIGFCEMLDAEIFGPLGHPRNKEYIRDIHGSGRRLLSLINDVLDLSRMDAGKMELRQEVFSIADVVARAMRTVEPQSVKAGVRVAKTLAPDLPRVWGDPRRIEQAVLNLLANAVKFTPEGGYVGIFVNRDSDGLRIAVADAGIGIAPEDLPRVFERFVQVDSTLARKYEGTGLGLPISKQFVELHGGRLSLESELHVGTTATITLPASRMVEATAVVAAAAAAA